MTAVDLLGDSWVSYLLLGLLVAVVALMLFSAINDYRAQQAMQEMLEAQHHSLAALQRWNGEIENRLQVILAHLGLPSAYQVEEDDEVQR